MSWLDPNSWFGSQRRKWGWILKKACVVLQGRGCASSTRKSGTLAFNMNDWITYASPECSGKPKCSKFLSVLTQIFLSYDSWSCSFFIRADLWIADLQELKIQHFLKISYLIIKYWVWYLTFLVLWLQNIRAPFYMLPRRPSGFHTLP